MISTALTLPGSLLTACASPTSTEAGATVAPTRLTVLYDAFG
jgi:hypothetical protein